MEKVLENILYASRWVLAPIYPGLGAALFLPGIKFFQVVLYSVPLAPGMSESDLKMSRH